MINLLKWFILLLLFSFNIFAQIDSLDFCENNFIKKEVVVKSSAFVFTDLIMENTARDQYLKTINHQLSYLQAFYSRYYSNFVLSNVKNIEINQINNSKVSDLFVTLDWANYSSHYDDYYRLGVIWLSDFKLIYDVQEVKYEASFDLYGCDDGTTYIEKVFLPKYPEFAFWQVDIKDRLELVYYNKKMAITNPCATNELADFNEPYYFWYFWDPFSLYSLANCIDSYSNLNFSVVGNIEYSDYELKPISNQGLSSRIKRVAIVYGNLDQSFNRNDLSNIQLNLDHWQSNLSLLDYNSQGLFTLINELKQITGFQNLTWDRGENFILIKLSFLDLSIEIFVSSSDLHSLMGQQHTDFFNQALTSSDFLIYFGHAGLGENFTHPIHLDPKLLTIKLIAFISCYSMRYPLREWWHKAPLLEGIYYTGYDVFNAPLEIMKVIDHALDLEFKEESLVNLAEPSFIFFEGKE